MSQIRRQRFVSYLTLRKTSNIDVQKKREIQWNGVFERKIFYRMILRNPPLPFTLRIHAVDSKVHEQK